MTNISPIAPKPTLGTLPDVAASIATRQSIISLNVKDFGALGDGSHDDTSAFKSAVAAAAAAGGGIIDIPRGVYIVSANLANTSTSTTSINAPITFRGAGSGYISAGSSTLGTVAGTAIVQSTYPAPMFIVNPGGSGTTFKDICFLQLQTKLLIQTANPTDSTQVQVTSTGRDFGEAIYISGASDVTIRDCYFFNLVTGIKYSAGASPVLNAANGLYYSPQMQRNVIRHCRFDHTDYGILATCQANFIWDCLHFSSIEYSQWAANIPPHGWYCNGNQPNSTNALGTSANPIQRGYGGSISNCVGDTNLFSEMFKAKFQDGLVVNNLVATNCERGMTFEQCHDSTFSNLVVRNLIAVDNVPGGLGTNSTGSGAAGLGLSDSVQNAIGWQDCNRSTATNVHINYALDVPAVLIRYTNPDYDGVTPLMSDFKLSNLTVIASFSPSFTNNQVVQVLGGTRVCLDKPTITNLSSNINSYPVFFGTGGGGVTPANATVAVQGCIHCTLDTPTTQGFRYILQVDPNGVLSANRSTSTHIVLNRDLIFGGFSLIGLADGSNQSTIDGYGANTLLDNGSGTHWTFHEPGTMFTFAVYAGVSAFTSATSPWITGQTLIKCGGGSALTIATLRGAVNGQRLRIVGTDTTTILADNPAGTTTAGNLHLGGTNWASNGKNAIDLVYQNPFWIKLGT